MPTNRLINETSPYLLQHAHNPVDWFAWNDEALTKAREENKPILISIGYSACHWCHVMEHESFEDEGVAKVMNELFVCIKVDREERPDLDKIYQTSHQILTQRSGGWPLNMFLTPDDHMPFFGGTYFPKEARHGLPAFVDLLHRVADFHRQHEDEIKKQSASMRDVFARIQPDDRADEKDIQQDVLTKAYQELHAQYDARDGGFGSAPKFPHPTSLERCLRQWALTAMSGKPDRVALAIARHGMRAMAQGGIYDQLGGGFCRYSVDEKWMIPHFEKMLYDNAQLLPLYADAAVVTDEFLFRRTVNGTAKWVLREMQSPEGGYYSTLDADSEGEEGKFYTWTTADIEALLDEPEWRAVRKRYGLDGQPNFEGKWNLHVEADFAGVAGALGLDIDDTAAVLASAHQKLFNARESRVRPGRDEKILTSWNGLMIKGMAHAGRLFRREEFIASAERALDFVRSVLWRDGRLLATTKDGKTHLNGYIDDVVFVMDGALELLQARWRGADLEFAIQLADTLLDRFEDKKNGGFFFTSNDHEQLVYRPKPTSDDAIPSGNGVAALVLLRLGHLLGEAKYLDAATRTIRALYGAISSQPAAHGSALLAVEEYLFPTETIVLRGSPQAMAPWHARCRQAYAPRRLAVAIPDGEKSLPGVLGERASRGAVTAYLCSGHSCSAPITDFDEFDSALRKNEVNRNAVAEKVMSD